MTGIDTVDLISTSTSEPPHWRDPHMVFATGWSFDFSTSGYCEERCHDVLEVAAPAPDGTNIAVAWTRYNLWDLYLTVLDAVNGTVINEFKLPTIDELDMSAVVGLEATWIDFNGHEAIISLKRFIGLGPGPYGSATSDDIGLLVDTATHTVILLPGPTGHVTIWPSQNT